MAGGYVGDAAMLRDDLYLEVARGPEAIILHAVVLVPPAAVSFLRPQQKPYPLGRGGDAAERLRWPVHFFARKRPV